MKNNIKLNKNTKKKTLITHVDRIQFDQESDIHPGLVDITVYNEKGVNKCPSQVRKN